MKHIVGISGNLGSGKDTAADRLVDEFGLVKVALADPIKRYGLRVFRFTEHQLWGPSEARNASDTRFKQCDSPYEGDDAWMAAFRRAEEYDKEYVKELFPEDHSMQLKARHALHDWMLILSKEHPHLSPRVMLQTLGTEWGRTIRDDLWISHAIKTSEKLLWGDLTYNPAYGLVENPGEGPPPGVILSDVRFHNELEHIRKANGFLIRIKRPATDDQANATGVDGHASEAEQQSFTDDEFNYVIVNDKSKEHFLNAIDFVGIILTGAGK